MAAIDVNMLFGDDVAFPASATTEYSDEIDFGLGKDAFDTARANPGIGVGSPVYLNFVVTEVASTGSSPTLTVNIVGGTATAPTTVLQIVCSAVAAATLVAGYKFSVALKAYPAMTRFLRLQLVAGTAGFSTGKYTAWLSNEPLASY